MVAAGSRVPQEDFVRMAFTPSHYDRLPLIETFQELVHSEPETSTSSRTL